MIIKLIDLYKNSKKVSFKKKITQNKIRNFFTKKIYDNEIMKLYFLFPFARTFILCPGLMIILFGSKKVEIGNSGVFPIICPLFNDVRELQLSELWLRQLLRLSFIFNKFLFTFIWELLWILVFLLIFLSNIIELDKIDFSSKSEFWLIFMRKIFPIKLPLFLIPEVPMKYKEKI